MEGAEKGEEDSPMQRRLISEQLYAMQFNQLNLVASINHLNCVNCKYIS